MIKRGSGRFYNSELEKRFFFLRKNTYSEVILVNNKINNAKQTLKDSVLCIQRVVQRMKKGKIVA